MENARRIPRKQSTGALINGIQVGEERLTFREIDTSPPISPVRSQPPANKDFPAEFLLAESFSPPPPPHRQIVHSDKGNLISSRDNPWSLSKHRSGRVPHHSTLSPPPEGWSERMNPIDGSGLRTVVQTKTIRVSSFSFGYSWSLRAVKCEGSGGDDYGLNRDSRYSHANRNVNVETQASLIASVKRNIIYGRYLKINFFFVSLRFVGIYCKTIIIKIRI